MQISSLIGKPVLSPAGETYGYVTGVRLTRDFEKLSTLLCADREEEEFFLPARAILSAGDAVLASKTRIPSPVGVPSPIGACAYSHTGELLGCVGDLLVEEGSEAMLVVVKGGIRTSYPVKSAYMGESVILYPSSAEKEAALRRMRGKERRTVDSEAPMSEEGPSEKPKRRPMSAHGGGKERAPMPEVPPLGPTEEVPMPTDPTPMPTDPTPMPAPVPIPTPEPPMPEREPVREPNPLPMPAPQEAQRSSPRAVCLNHNNLLGRRVKRSVYDRSGMPVAIAGERITPAVLSAARRANRLLQLTANTLTFSY